MSRIALCVLAIAALAMVLVPASASDSDASTEVNYDYDVATKALTVTGSGEMGDGELDQYSDVVTVRILGDVTAVGKYNFSGFTDLKSVYIGDSVKEIGTEAFRGCTGLIEISFGNAVETIGSAAFRGCICLSDVSFPESLERIENNAFYKTGLRADLSIPDNVLEIGDYAFFDTDITDLELGSSVRSIGECAFARCGGIQTLRIPDSVTEIGNYAFALCKGIEHVYLGENTTSLGVEAFSMCKSLMSVSPVEQLKTIQDKAFLRCASLTGHIDLESVVELGEAAFSETGITSVSLGDGLKEIERDVFRSCHSLQSMEFSDGIVSIEDNAFYDCTRLTDVVLPSTVCSIGSNSFADCSSLVRVDFNDGLESIGGAAFLNTTSLISISIPDSVSMIGPYAFGIDTQLYEGSEDEGDDPVDPPSDDQPPEESDGGWWDDLFDWIFAVPEPPSTVVSNAPNLSINSNNVVTVTTFSVQRASTSSVVLDLGEVEVIGQSAFKGRDIISLEMSGCLETIGPAAFQDTNVSGALDLRSVKHIEDSAFSKCTGIKEVFLGDDLEYIGDNAFSGCTGLQKITIGARVSDIGKNAFSGCLSLKNVENRSGMSLTNVIPSTAVVVTITDPSLEFTVTWKNYDGVILYEKTYTHRQKLDYGGPEPTRPMDAQYTYEFSGWDNTSTTATNDFIINAVYDKSPRTYTVRWLNEDGTLIKTQMVPYGEIPEFEGEVPTKDATFNTTFSHSGWLPDLAPVNGNVDYTATYNASPREYSVTYKFGDHIIRTETLEYGSKIVPPGYFYCGGERYRVHGWIDLPSDGLVLSDCSIQAIAVVEADPLSISNGVLYVEDSYGVHFSEDAISYIKKYDEFQRGFSIYTSVGYIIVPEGAVRSIEGGECDFAILPMGLQDENGHDSYRVLLPEGLSEVRVGLKNSWCGYSNGHSIGILDDDMNETGSIGAESTGSMLYFYVGPGVYSIKHNEESGGLCTLSMLGSMMMVGVAAVAVAVVRVF